MITKYTYSCTAKYSSILHVSLSMVVHVLGTYIGMGMIYIASYVYVGATCQPTPTQ